MSKKRVSGQASHSNGRVTKATATKSSGKTVKTSSADLRRNTYTQDRKPGLYVSTLPTKR